MTILDVLARISNHRFCSTVLLTGLILVGAGTGQPATARDLLAVSNATSPAQAVINITEAELLALPQITVRTRTTYTDGVVEFVGPLARDAIASIKTGTATTVHLVAANDYAIDIPLSDLVKYDVILAMQANGKRLTRRDKGPIWLMYPLDAHAELQDPVYNIRLIWQLTAMELR